jgi:hypothetical protein
MGSAAAEQTHEIVAAQFNNGNLAQRSKASGCSRIRNVSLRTECLTRHTVLDLK